MLFINCDNLERLFQLLQTTELPKSRKMLFV